jgi:molybdate transport system permease protein
VPLLLLVPAGLAVGFLAIPLLGLLEETAWRDLPEELATPLVLQALRLSLVCSLGAVAVSVVLGVPLAFLLARVDFPGRNLVRALTTLPMVFPPVVGGVALLLAFGRRGLVGQWLDRAFGITLPFTTAGAILAEAFVSMPFLIITVEAGLRAMDRRYEDAAATLGASRWTTLRRVTLPLVAPSLGAGIALSWARALGEFGATITFAGNLPGVTQTMPLAVYIALETDLEAAIALSLILLAISLVVLIALRDRWFPSASA